MTQPMISIDLSPPPYILAEEVDHLAVLMQDMTEPLRKAVLEVMIPSFQENFAMGGRPSWEPVSDATQVIKGALHASSQTLVRTGALQHAMADISIWDINQDIAQITSLPAEVYYGSVHQDGSRSGGGRGSNIPARPFAVIQDQDETRIEEVFDNWLGDKIAGVGWY